MATTWFLDSSVSSSGDGLSWATAFKNCSDVTGPTGDDTVYISGGPTGMSQTYDIPAIGYWSPPSGTAGHIITYQIGQDALHNGTAIFDNIAGTLLDGAHYVKFSGDAGDGQLHFKVAASPGKQIFTNCDYDEICYIDASAGVSKMGTLSNNHSNNIHHIYVLCNDMSLGEGTLNGTGLQGTVSTDIQIHHCTILVPYKSSDPGYGVDGIEFSGHGYSVYNNIIKGYPAAYTAGQHQDGIQDTGGSSDIKIYNNYFEDIGNYCIYLEPHFGGFTDTWVFNNVCQIVDPTIRTINPCGISTGAGGTNAATRLYVFNNLAVDYNVANNTPGIGMNNATNPGTAGLFNSCIFQNNLIVNSGTGFNVDTTVSVNSNNVVLTAAQAAGLFTSYTSYSATNDMHLTSLATSLIGQGVDLSALWTTDKDGVVRVTPWDVGAYAYNTAGATPTRALGFLLTQI